VATIATTEMATNHRPPEIPRVGMRDGQPVTLMPFRYAGFATLMCSGLSGGVAAVFFVEKSE
jgi:hypothetical protein